MRKVNPGRLGREAGTFCHSLNMFEVAIEKTAKLYTDYKFYFSQQGKLLGVPRLRFHNRGFAPAQPG